VTDRLDRAFRALRETETGKSPESEETLHRVLARRRVAARTLRRRVRLWLPIAAVLAVSGAALARWASFERTRATTSLEGSAELARTTAARTPAARSPETPAPTPTSSPEEAPLGVALSAPSEILPRAVAPATGQASASPALAVPAHASASAHDLAPASASPSASVRAAPSPPEPPASANGAPSDSDVYARAHRLHFEGSDPAAALRALDEYLLRFPDGRFAPDARYNRAIDLLKLRRYVEARAALQPFADGALGGYHREDARELLRSIP
jgi:hypothetical protein